MVQALCLALLACGGQGAATPVLPIFFVLHIAGHGGNDVVHVLPAAKAQGRAHIPFPLLSIQLGFVGLVEQLQGHAKILALGMGFTCCTIGEACLFGSEAA